MFLAFALFGMLPLACYILAGMLAPSLDVTSLFSVAYVATVISLFALGAFKARFHDKRYLYAGVETVLLGRPEKIEAVTVQNHEACVTHRKGGDLQAWEELVRALPGRLTAGECLTPLVYTKFDYLDIGKSWQRPVGLCKGDKAHVVASVSPALRERRKFRPTNNTSVAADVTAPPQICLSAGLDDRDSSPATIRELASAAVHAAKAISLRIALYDALCRKGSSVEKGNELNASRGASGEDYSHFFVASFVSVLMVSPGGVGVDTLGPVPVSGLEGAQPPSPDFTPWSAVTTAVGGSRRSLSASPRRSLSTTSPAAASSSPSTAAQRAPLRSARLNCLPKAAPLRSSSTASPARRHWRAQRSAIASATSPRLTT
jgi:hypothetical protein